MQDDYTDRRVGLVKALQYLLIPRREELHERTINRRQQLKDALLKGMNVLHIGEQHD